jgi:four helix bundle protein
MAAITRFQDLDCWRKARELENYVFILTQKSDFSRDFGHKGQINNATGSAMDNIAEGFGRGSNKEFLNFLIYAKASTLEAESQIIRASDRKYITEHEFEVAFKKAEETVSSITNFMNFLRKDLARTYRKLEE